MDKKKQAALELVRQKREEIFKTYQLTQVEYPEMSAIDFTFGNFRNYLAKSPSGRYYSLKFVVLEDKIGNFKRELKTLKWFTEQKVPFTPRFVNGEWDKKISWYLYKTIPGKIAGHISRDFALSKFFFKQNYLDQTVQNLKTLRGLTPKIPIHLPTWHYELTKKRVWTTTRAYHDAVTKEEKTIISKARIYIRQHKNLLNNVHFYLSHNDLHPGNVIINPNTNSVNFIDFEWAGFSNICSDFCFFYLFSWRNPEFQKSLVKGFKKSLTGEQKKEFERLFPVQYVYTLLCYGGFSIAWYDKSKADAQTIGDGRGFVMSELKRLIK